MKSVNIVLAGVGGQGILLAAEILGTAAVKEGLDVRVSEIHGMAQRGGAVTSDVRIAETVLSPTVMEAGADILVGFEPLEALRNIRYASKSTLVIMGDEAIPPAELAAKGLPYPPLSEIVKKATEFTKNVTIIEATALAKVAGNVLARNTVMIGALAASGKLPLGRESLLAAIKELVPQKYAEANIRAFELGFECMGKKQ